MKEFRSIDIRPYQMLCVICRQGRRNEAEPYYHESRLDEILAAVRADPVVPLTARCHTDTVFRYQNPGREYDTPEGERYNDLRDLTVLQRIGAAPGSTLPAIDFFGRILDAIPTHQGLCGYPEAEAPGWPRCRFADSGNYERGVALGIGAIVPGRTPDEMNAVKEESANACCLADRLRIRPHHLLCMTCFHAGRSGETLAPIQEDNLCECIRAVQRNPDKMIELIHGPCMVCPPCDNYHAASNLCIGGKSMGLRDDKKDLDTLRRLGLRYGDVLPARELLQRVYRAIASTTEICGYGDGVERSGEWRVCGGPTGNASYGRGRQSGLGVSGVSVPENPTSRIECAPRVLVGKPPPWLVRPRVRLQPVLARPGRPNLDLAVVAEQVAELAEVLPPIAIESPEQWTRVVRGLGGDVDGILPVSVPAYPTEVWNAHPQALVERRLPFIFWPLTAYDEPDFWRWSACDFLRALGVEAHLVPNRRGGQTLARALGMRRFLRGSRMVVFGEQNFPWNAHAAGRLVTQSLGTEIRVRPIRDIRERAAGFGEAAVKEAWAARRGRYEEGGVRPAELADAVRVYLAVRGILEEEQALGFGVNCFGDLIPGGRRDVPCLAQSLLREDGFIASCDGDYLAMMSMALATYFLDKPCMMSNMYPVRYVGALRDHFGDPLSPDPAAHPEAEWRNLARLAHCGFVGVVPPEMTPSGRVTLRDWGGTYEIHRDGRGCGVDAALAPGCATVLELKFDGRTLLIADAEVLETTRHPALPHCEATALMRFRDLEGFVADISREHAVVVFGKHADDFRQLAAVLGLTARVY